MPLLPNKLKEPLFSYNINFYLSYNNICVKSEKSSVDQPQDVSGNPTKKGILIFQYPLFHPIQNELAQ